jgi:hypothetical protein
VVRNSSFLKKLGPRFRGDERERRAATDNIGSLSSKRKPEFRERTDAMLVGDADTGKIILCDTVNVTVGFEKLGASTA